MDRDKERLISQGKPIPTNLMAPGTKKKGKHARTRERTRKLKAEHDQLQSEHEELKKHKRERSIMYQDEIEALRRMLAEMEVEKQTELAGEDAQGDDSAASEAERIQKEKEEAEKAREEAERAREEAERIKAEAEQVRIEAQKLKEEAERARQLLASGQNPPLDDSHAEAERERLEAERLRQEAEAVRQEAQREKEKIEKLKEETLRLKEETAQRAEDIKKNKHRRNRSLFYQDEITKLKEKTEELESERDKTVEELELLKHKTGHDELEQSGEMKSDGFLDPSTNKFTAYQLRHNEVEGIDLSSKELYLSNEEFQLVFQMDTDAYASLAAWRKQKLKKKVGLF